ncbi:MAG TPA: PfkB family carbohydrate kinase, partial [Lachnospiraceae bacterium]
MKVLNFGSLNLDYVYSVDHMVMVGETQSSSNMQVFCGGKGLNQSIALAKAGVCVYHAGLIGNEGDVLLEVCKEANVHTEFIRRVDEKSGHTIIQVDKTGQNCILLYGGANQCITKEFVDEVLSTFSAGDILLLQNEINMLPYIIDCAYQKGLRIIMNPSPFNEKLRECDLNKIAMFL